MFLLAVIVDTEGDGGGGDRLHGLQSLPGLGQSSHHQHDLSGQEPGHARQEHQHQEGCLGRGVMLGADFGWDNKQSYKETDYEGNLHRFVQGCHHSLLID